MYLIGLIKQSNPRDLFDPRSFRTQQGVVDFFSQYIKDFFDLLDPIDEATIRYHLQEPVPYLIRFTDMDLALLLGNQAAINQATDQFTYEGGLSQEFACFDSFMGVLFTGQSNRRLSK